MPFHLFCDYNQIRSYKFRLQDANVAFCNTNNPVIAIILRISKRLYNFISFLLEQYKIARQQLTKYVAKFPKE